MRVLLHQRGLWLLACVLLLAACGVPTEVEEELTSGGASDPEAAAAGFFQTLNQALEDPDIIHIDTRRLWAERLTTWFPPSERLGLRFPLQQMIATFVEGREALDDDIEVTLEVSFSAIEVMEQQDRRASVRLIDGNLHYRRIHVAENGYRTVLIDDQQPLGQVLGLDGGALPAVQVNGRWFLTESNR